MSTWQVTERATGTVVYAYTADEAVDWPDYPFAAYNHAREIPVEAPAPTRRVTKLQFIERIGEAAYRAILEMSLSSVDVLAWVKLIDWATPEPDETSIDLDDPRTVSGLETFEPLLIAQGVVTAGWAAGVVA